ncbi:MAG: DUF2934 domain-containing protein [Gammaproteobacteria bacterium]|nr:DUF2934 domain-containing protein [Gammaproteobacteria bacterium]MCP5406453.1 DUF2934 domain-containing protein [Chromatiaceae bacterium]MCP5408121.1 DUF2934 domain-containing protein [Chromatiaceae bacterium]MCP5443020.1 DUF2934 domain-containing protein [Chromatiaceae bacterium]
MAVQWRVGFGWAVISKGESRVAELKNDEKTVVVKKKVAAKKTVAKKKIAPTKTVAKKKVAKKTVTKKRAAVRAATNTGQTMFSQRDRYEMIAKMAYFRAEKRGFEPGWEQEDWLECEKLIDDMLHKT